MDPIVTEVIHVSHPFFFGKHVGYLLFPSGLYVIDIDLRIRDPDTPFVSAFVSDRLEFMQMIIHPAHRVLDRDMQIPKGIILGNQYSLPKPNCITLLETADACRNPPGPIPHTTVCSTLTTSDPICRFVRGPRQSSVPPPRSISRPIAVAI
jgi:hypothetical protein